MEELKVGLIAGRHNLPVNEYIINFEIEDIEMDYMKIYNTIMDFIRYKVGVTIKSGLGINNIWGSDNKIYVGKRHLIVYVTGLTIVTTELIAQCMINGVPLTLMHYNNKTGKYFSQLIIPE